MKPVSRCIAFRALPWLEKFNLVGILAVIAAFTALLWPQWRRNEDLHYSFFLPVLAGVLVVESRRDPNPRFLQMGAAVSRACALLLFASLAGFAVALAFAAALGWSYAMAEVALAISLVAALGAAWLGFSDERVRFLPINYAAAVSVLIWIFASPPLPGTYERLAFFLQTLVTNGVVRILNALGIAAYQNGNVIELARTSVGVSESCSGVRSLISCTVAGIFLSAILVRRKGCRAWVILVAPAIGLAMNFLRALLLTLLANAGVNIEGRWHDITGASILTVTSVLVAAFALWLHRREPARAEVPTEAPVLSTGPSKVQAMVAATLLLAAGISGCFIVGTSMEGESSVIAPDLALLLPAPPPGWTERTTTNLEQFSEVLHTHTLVERVYSAGPALEDLHLTLYLAYWRPGEASVSLVDGHTPDACWPGTGWESKPVPDERSVLLLGDRHLPPAECRLFVRNQFETHVWFWHLYGGRPLTFSDPFSPVRVLGLALHYGFGRAEDQLFVRVSSNRPWGEIASKPALRQFFSNLKPLGL